MQKELNYKGNVKFSHTDTTTVGKLQTIIWQVATVVQRFQGFTGSAWGIPGGGSQCQRHVQEYQAYGFKAEAVNLMEIDPATFETQKKWAKASNFPGQLHIGNGFDILEKALKGEGKISLVDWDDTKLLHCNHIRLLRQCAKAGVDVILLTLCTRGRITPRLKIEKRRFKRRRRRTNNNGGKLSEPIRELTVQTVERFARLAGYECHARPYRGLTTPMLSFVLIRKSI